ncbi:hypothetical protein BpHYR1_047980 [Brachionus plicatilis]|uniref:WW domain-containing protein n=1 Tax=Brachionus plicatilis TaxID=10195 RepID=A0A3M7R2N9_BRAPC|nr:hypothetical protein BpHYR1_047980 [Brachionus plicatilis]
MSSDQIIIEYDENIQPTDEDIVEYAKYIGIEPDQEPELMWIARQGVKAPLPKGWKAVHDPLQEELYYFNFETGESIWDHPCDKDYKNLVINERKIVQLNGKANYRPSESKVPSPFATMKSGTSKSTSTLSDVLNNANRNKLKNDFIFANDYGIEFEEELKRDMEEDSEASWKKKSESDDSDDFRKPVDFGIDKETSIKLDKLNVVLMVGKEKETNLSTNNGDSAPTTSRDVLDSPTRNYIKSVLGASRDEEARKSVKLDSLAEESVDESKPVIKNKDEELKVLRQSLDREYDQRRLELLEEKEARIKKLKLEIESDVNKAIEMEKKKIQQDQDEKLNSLKNRLNFDFENEKELMTKKHLDILNSMQKDYDDEKQLKKQKFSMQLSKYIKSGKSFDELDENEEKREIEIYFDHIEKKYSDKLDERKKELQLRYDKKTKDLEEELAQLYEKETELKENQMRQIKEENLRLENFERQMEKILAEKVKQFKDKESNELSQLKEDYDIKIKTFKEKYKQLEENEFKFFENEYNKVKERLQIEFKAKVSAFQTKLENDRASLQKQEEDVKKKFEIISTRRKELETEWVKLNEQEQQIESKKEEMNSKILEKTESEDKLKFEIEKLRLENQDLNLKLSSMQKVLDKYYTFEDTQIDHQRNQVNDLNEEDSIRLSEKINKINTRLSQEYEDDDDIENTNDDTDIKSLIKHAKIKLKLKYSNDIELNSSKSQDELESSIEEFTDAHLTESKRAMIHYLNKEKDSLNVFNEMMDQYKIILGKRKQDLSRSKNELKNYEAQCKNLKQSEKFKITLILDEKNINLEKESLDLEQLELNIKTARRLIKQKKQLLIQLENYLLGNMVNLISSDTSQEETDLDESRLSTIDHEFKFTDKNLTEFVSQMKKAHLNGDITDNNLSYIQSILKKMPKLNSRLDTTLESIKESNFHVEEKAPKIDSEQIEKKWKSYLNNKKYESINESSKMVKTVGPHIQPWQANPAYYRLTYEQGTKMLNDKWNQYIGFDSMIRKIDQSQFVTNLNSTTHGLSYLPGQVTIPLSTQNRLNHHREWIRQFKASDSLICFAYSLQSFIYDAILKTSDSLKIFKYLKYLRVKKKRKL